CSRYRGDGLSVVTHPLRFCVVAASLMLIAVGDATQYTSGARPPGRDLRGQLTVFLLDVTLLVTADQDSPGGNPALVRLADVQTGVDPCVADVLDDLSDSLGRPDTV